MTKRKNGFLNFIFSCLPGAGQMYQGYMKRGASLMLLFFGWCALCYTMSPVAVMWALIPPVWFFSFFDGLHLNTMTDEEREQKSDAFLLPGQGQLDGVNEKAFRVPLAILFLFVGGYGFLKMLIRILINANVLYWSSVVTQFVYYYLPQCFVSLVIIGIGVRLLIGKKQEMDRAEAKEPMQEGGGDFGA